MKKVVFAVIIIAAVLMGCNQIFTTTIIGTWHVDHGNGEYTEYEFRQHGLFDAIKYGVGGTVGSIMTGTYVIVGNAIALEYTIDATTDKSESWELYFVPHLDQMLWIIPGKSYLDGKILQRM